MILKVDIIYLFNFVNVFRHSRRSKSSDSDAKEEATPPTQGSARKRSRGRPIRKPNVAESQPESKESPTPRTKAVDFKNDGGDALHKDASCEQDAASDVNGGDQADSSSRTRIIQETQESQVEKSQDSEDMIENSQVVPVVQVIASDNKKCFVKIDKNVMIQGIHSNAQNGKTTHVDQASDDISDAKRVGSEQASSSDANRQNGTMESKKYPKAVIAAGSRLELQGRAAHMLGLLIKQSPTTAADNGLRKGKAETSSPRSTVVKSLRESADITSSPSGSRQRKMFTNMNLTPSKIVSFRNLKNNGEKVSPKSQKLHEQEDLGCGDKSVSSSDSPTCRIEMLNWSSANGPDLNASPSIGILKQARQQQQQQQDADNESTTPGKARMLFVYL